MSMPLYDSAAEATIAADIYSYAHFDMHLTSTERLALTQLEVSRGLNNVSLITKADDARADIMGS